MQDSWIFNILSFRFTPMEFQSIAVPPVESASAGIDARRTRFALLVGTRQFVQKSTLLRADGRNKQLSGCRRIPTRLRP